MQKNSSGVLFSKTHDDGVILWLAESVGIVSLVCRWSLLWSWIYALKIVSHDVLASYTLVKCVTKESEQSSWIQTQALRTVHEKIIIYQLFCSINNEKWDASISKSCVRWLCIPRDQNFLCRSSLKHTSQAQQNCMKNVKLLFVFVIWNLSFLVQCFCTFPMYYLWLHRAQSTFYYSPLYKTLFLIL